MASPIKAHKSTNQIKNMSVSLLRKEYMDLASDYDRLLKQEVIICPECGRPLSRKKSFYISKSYGQGYYPICKECTLMEVEQRTSKDAEPNETKESVMKVLRKMNLPYIDSVYTKQQKKKEEGFESSPFSKYISTVSSLPQYKNWTYEDSVFGSTKSLSDDGALKIDGETIRRFGKGYSESDYDILRREYDDWITRYECQTKAQEEIFIALSINKLMRMKNLRQGKPTKDLDRTMQDLLNSGDILPKKNAASNFTESKTFGTLIQEWENEDPIPKADDDLKDVDKIGTYLDVFFKGHLSKTLHLANPLASIYENYIKQYTVNKPEYVDEDENVEDTFLKIFGDVDSE